MVEYANLESVGPSMPPSLAKTYSSSYNQTAAGLAIVRQEKRPLLSPYISSLSSSPIPRSPINPLRPSHCAQPPKPKPLSRRYMRIVPPPTSSSISVKQSALTTHIMVLVLVRTAKVKMFRRLKIVIFSGREGESSPLLPVLLLDW